MAISRAQFFHRQSQHRLVQAHVRIANLELRGVDAHRHAARARGQVIARERALPPFVELAIGVERQRMRGNHYAAPQFLAPAPVGHQKRPSRVSKCVGL